ncbi:hypothetical protein PUN28_015698 [Cardiocondyla obscurior]|uniref:Uncharacterized protein n=1 Tax=Cardiocondyla obscurior TaxID=286306 RepID=A0AAW2EZB9_9HYME
MIEICFARADRRSRENEKEKEKEKDRPTRHSLYYSLLKQLSRDEQLRSLKRQVNRSILQFGSYSLPRSRIDSQKNTRRSREKEITALGESLQTKDSNKFSMLAGRRRCFISAMYARPVWNRTPRSPLIKYRDLHNLFRSSYKSLLARVVYLEC